MFRSFPPSLSPFFSYSLLVFCVVVSAALLVAAPVFCQDAACLWLPALPACALLVLFLIRERSRLACRAKFDALRMANERRSKRARDLLGQTRILRAISRQRPLEESMGILCRFVEERIAGARCSILMLDSAGRAVNQSVAPSLPDDYNQALIGLEIGPTVGSCGAAMHLRQQVFIDDILHHPNWAPFHDLVLSTGMQACWSSPVLDEDGQSIGAFAVYNEQPRQPTHRERLTIHAAIEMAHIAINMVAMHRLLIHQSLRDELTGLVNRRGVKKWLTQHLELGCPLSVFLLDLDDFKPVNDTFGHSGGNKVLRVVAGRLHDLAPSDAIVSRLGGDEFVLGIPSTDVQVLEDLARQIVEAIGRPIAIDPEHSTRVGCSLGIAHTPQDGDTVEALLTHADQAMYVAKKSGKNQHCHYGDTTPPSVPHHRADT